MAISNGTSAYTSPTTKPLYRGTQVVWYIVGLLEALLAFRFVLKLLGANAQPFAAPFLSVFRITRVEGSIFEWTTLLAMLVYWLVALAIVRLFLMGKTVSTPEAAVKLDNQDQ